MLQNEEKKSDPDVKISKRDPKELFSSFSAEIDFARNMMSHFRTR